MRTTLLLTGATMLVSVSATRAQTLPPVPTPPQNPITEPKRVLGKILFWEEQLSSDNTVACGTCHRPADAGADPRIAVHPGADESFGTADDVLGSEGVIRCDDDDAFLADPLFALETQVTGRTTPTFIMAQYAPTLLWDGRATGQFVDPQTGTVSIFAGGALESQAVGPVLSDVEMAHEARDWTQVSENLASARPMALATELTDDMTAALEANPTYPDLFRAAFGDPAITAERIAFAIATYERTLVPDQTPWDLFVQGQTNALTPQQQQGLNVFQGVGCAVCHTPPLFTNNTFRNIGVRPVAEDPGRQEVTGNPADRGRFKVPTLRHVGLKPTLMHTGRIVNVSDAVNFYMELGGHQQFQDNLDPILPLNPVPPQPRNALVAFVRDGLIDPRVADETFPFDRPTLHSESTPANPALIGTGTPGAGGLAPRMIAVSPPNLGNDGFKIGIDQALGGAEAFVALSTTRPADGTIDAEELHGPIQLGADGTGTWHWPIPADPARIDDVVFLQWIVDDPSGAGGEARTSVARLTIFCAANCPCPGDTDGNSAIDVDDIVNVVLDWGTDGSANGGDVDASGLVNIDDIVYVVLRLGPCL